MEELQGPADRCCWKSRRSSMIATVLHLLAQLGVHSVHQGSSWTGADTVRAWLFVVLASDPDPSEGSISISSISSRAVLASRGEPLVLVLRQQPTVFLGTALPHPKILSGHSHSMLQVACQHYIVCEMDTSKQASKQASQQQQQQQQHDR